MDYDAPGGWRLPPDFADGSAGGPEHSHNVAGMKDVFMRHPIVRAHGEIAPPADAHLFAAVNGGAERVDENVIVGHQRGQFVRVVPIDGIEKSESCFDRIHGTCN